jgi:O-antigen/teichoic acid export membrane protein
MSLAIGQLAGASVGAVLFIAFEPAGVRIGFDPTRATALLRFGLPLAGSSVVVFAVANVDRLIVGAVLGPVPLGVYVLAVNLSNWPVVMFSQPVRSVAPAMLARLQGEPPALRAALLSCARLLAATSLPACAALAGAAGPVIRLVYGAPWAGAADVLPWLAVLAGLRILFELCYDFFVVLARTRVVFTAQLVWLIALVPSVWAGVHLFGVAGSAALQVLVACVLVLPLYVVQLHGYGISAGLLMSRLMPPVIVAAVVAALAWLASRLPGGQLPGLAISGLACGGAVALLLYRMRSDLQTLRGTGAVYTRTDADRGDPVPATRPPSQAFEVVGSGPLPSSAEPAPVVTARPPVG